jgi:ABC-type antimicrobial peptide transport system permease subunit
LRLFGTGELSVRPVVSLSVVILSLIVGILISIITGILPALRASRVKQSQGPRLIQQ